MKSIRSKILIFFSLFCIICTLLLSSCNSPTVVSSATSNTTTSDVNTAVTTPVKPTAVGLVAADLEHLVTLNEETTISADGKSAIVKITAANSKDDSVVLSVKQGTGENVKKVLANQVISFGTLRICVAQTLVDEKTGSAQALIVPTYAQKAVAWFSMVAPTDVNQTCGVFKSAVSFSSKKDGAVTFFSEQFKSTSDAKEFVQTAYTTLLGKSLDALSSQAWEFYVAQNGREKFLALLVASEDFKLHENSIK